MIEGNAVKVHVRIFNAGGVNMGGSRIFILANDEAGKAANEFFKEVHSY